MKLEVTEDVKKLGVKVKAVIIKNVDNKKVDKAYQEYHDKKINDLLKKYEDINIKEDKILEGFHVLHDNAHIPRRKNVGASENLIKLLKKHNGLPIINKVVDIYNLLSLETKLALGAHDIDKIDGNVTLRLTKGDELFIPLGSEEPTSVKAGEYAYIDDSNEILCRLEVRQVNKTKITEKSQNIFYIVQGNQETSDAYLENACKDLIAITTKYCGGEGHMID